MIKANDFKINYRLALFQIFSDLLPLLKGIIKIKSPVKTIKPMIIKIHKSVFLFDKYFYF